MKEANVLYQEQIVGSSNTRSYPQFPKPRTASKISITARMFGFSLRFHAIFSAYLSILAGIVEAVLSSMAGHEEVSMSLYGIALMAFVDITGSVLVLSLWQCSRAVYGTERPKSERFKEMHYSIIIGYLMVALGIFLMADRLDTWD